MKAMTLHTKSYKLEVIADADLQKTMTKWLWRRRERPACRRQGFEPSLQTPD